MNQLESCSRKVALIVIISGLPLAFACTTIGGGTTKTPAEGQAASTLAAIKETYTPIPCFTSDFDIEMRQTGSFNKRARGELRVDNQLDRMRLVIKDRLLGLSLSEMTLVDGIIYLKNIGQDRQVIPREEFQVSGLGNNAIVLPFSLFQDLLYGKIPGDVFTKYESATTENGALVVLLKKPEAAYNYRFVSNRLAEMKYEPVGQNGVVEVALNGQFQATSFPGAINIAMREGGRINETMNITFQRVDPRAQCTDARFPTP